MAAAPADEKVADFVEAFALEAEQAGWPRIAGKILGWLLVAPYPRQSPPELVAALGISKASVSSMTRFLIDRSFIERCTKPGDRKVYYRLSAELWPRLLKARLGGVSAFHQLAERAVAMLADTKPDHSDRAREMAAFYAWWSAEVPGLLERWESYRRKRQ